MQQLIYISVNTKISTHGQTLLKPEKIILCCCADYKTIAPERLQQLLAATDNANIELQLFADLCLETVSNPEYFKNLEQDATIVAACYPRTVKSLLAATGATATLEVINLRTDDINTICSKLEISNRPTNTTEVELPEYRNDWKAWFPVIDYQKCTNCGKCIDYCLFGVYSRIDTQVRVTSPAQCKTDCPACARMCPAQAIIFPKHTDPVICGGEPDNQSGSHSDDADDDLYSRLARRRQAQKKDKLLKD